MTSFTTGFDDLPIDQAGLTAVQVIPLKEVSITLFMLYGHPGRPSGGTEYNLQFHKIIDYKLQMTSFSCEICIVQSHATLKDSEFLRLCRARPKKLSREVNIENLYHFQIVLDKGQLDVIAENFSWNLF